MPHAENPCAMLLALSWTRRSSGRAGSWGLSPSGGPQHSGRAPASRAPPEGPPASKAAHAAPCSALLQRAPGGCLRDSSRSRETSRSHHSRFLSWRFSRHSSSSSAGHLVNWQFSGQFNLPLCRVLPGAVPWRGLECAFSVR
ncbi:hypothetical protein P7K49_039393 [Saguinus oedipus]|uniref:Uncharacterized protein n=1 Tax=Saguinus oedipus TaxID=9490 RepID=A0ABQ9TBR2_SAGOE|nr:hypothetical protein P7K49_039393 [Saguinus oedipus]